MSPGENTFDAISDQPLSKGLFALKTQHMHSTSLARLENNVREHIAGILGLVENAIACFYGDAGRATESYRDTTVISAI